MSINRTREGAVRIGRLDQRIQFEEPVRVSDGAGGWDTTWEDVFDFDLWASIRPIRGWERDHAERNDAQTSYICVIRYRSGIEENMRVRWINAGRTFNIRFIQDAGPKPLYLPIEMDGGVAT